MTQLVPLLEHPDVYPCGGYYSCIRNEYVSMNERHHQQVPEFTPKANTIWSLAFGMLRDRHPCSAVSRMSEKDLLANAPQSRRKRIAEAYGRLHRNGWTDRYAQGKMFTKWEKFQDDGSLLDGCVRLIQHRSDEYCYTLARYLKPVEKRILYSRKRGDRDFAKGMTPAQRARRMQRMDKWSDTVWLELDHSRYDAHLQEGIRSKAREYFCDFYVNDRKLRHLLTLQRDNKFVSASGIRYKMRGTMCSGDYNTSLEDNVINLAILLYLMRNVPDAEFLVDGDDSVISLSAQDLHLVNLSDLTEACLTTKSIVKHIRNEVDFCQCRPLNIGGHPRLVRNPFRVISRAPYTIKRYQNEMVYRRLLKAVAMCELSCNVGVPVLQSFAMCLSSSAGDVAPLAGELDEMLHYRRVKLRLDPKPITDEARADFAVAFGILPEEQRGLETLFDSTVLPVLLAGSREG